MNNAIKIIPILEELVRKRNLDPHIIAFEKFGQPAHFSYNGDQQQQPCPAWATPTTSSSDPPSSIPRSSSIAPVLAARRCRPSATRMPGILSPTILMKRTESGLHEEAQPSEMDESKLTLHASQPSLRWSSPSSNTAAAYPHI